jgi:hypothetical protein
VSFDDARIRLERARSNVDRLRVSVAAFAKSHPHKVRVDQDGKGRVRLIATVPDSPPRDWALVVGDVLEDLRAVLDYAVYALSVASSAQNPPPSASRLAFPICKDAAAWRSAIAQRRLDGLSAEAIAWIESQQPYQPDNVGTSEAPAALLVFDQLVGIHKHRFLPVMWALLDALELPIQVMDAGIEEFVAYRLAGELVDGAVLAEFRVAAKAKVARVRLSPTIRTHVAFDLDVTGGARFDVPWFLEGMVVVADQYLGQLEAFA